MRFLKRHLTPALLAAVLLLTFSPLVPTARAVYLDAERTWAAEVVEQASQYGLMEGYPDGRFGVGVNMTRAEFVTVLCRMFSWEKRDYEQSIHRDCDGHWAQGYIDAAAEHGVESHAGGFFPDDYISRSDMAQMLVQALGLGDLAYTLREAALPFDDVTENRGAVSIAYHLGIINGVDQNGQLKFLPSFSAPREQAAAMLVRCYHILHNDVKPWRHGFYALSSYSQIDYVDALDAVSVGWAQLQYIDGAPLLNDTIAHNNEWVRPQGADEVTGRLAQSAIPCNLSVFSAAAAFASATETQADQVLSLLVEAAAPYAGLTIDFEGLREDQKDNFTAFMTRLRSALPAGKTLYVCVPPDTWYGGYDYRALGELCDRVILMAHDYQWASIPDYYVGTGSTYCPVTPFAQVYTALAHITDPQTGVQDKDKLALAISFNTTGFHVDEEGLLLDQTFYHPASATIAQRLGQPDSVRTWDAESRNPCLEYTAEDGEHYKLWYEDAQSVREKLDLARLFGVSHLSIWRLGVIPDYPEIENYDVWSVLSAY